MSEKTLQERFTEFKNQVESLRNQLVQTGEMFLVEHIQNILNKYPQLEKISWRAYTPYFNDGETCYFISRHTSPDIEGENLKYGTPEYEQIKKELVEFLSQFDDDLMLDLFGGHVQIVITREGLAVEEYEHD
jgi:hypothetical protein